MFKKFRDLLLIPKDDEITVDVSGGSSTPAAVDANVSFIDDGDNTHIELPSDKPEPKPAPQAFNPQQNPQQQNNNVDVLNVLADIRNRLGNNNQRQDSDEFKSELDNLSERERSLGVQWEVLKSQNKLDKSNLDDFERKSREIQDRRSEISAQKALKSVLPQIMNAQRANHYQVQYADIHSNPRALQFAKGTYDRLLAEGAADGPELIDRSMNEARVRFSMPGGKAAPNNNDRQQLSGVSGGGGRVKTDNTVRMTKAEKSMAIEMYGSRFNGDEKKAYAAWAKGPGIRAKRQEEKIRARGGF